MNDSDRTEAKRIFEVTQAIIIGEHFVYAEKEDGWYHGYDYVKKDAIYALLIEFKRLARIIATHFNVTAQRFKVVVGPTVGGALLAQRVADYLYLNDEVRKIFPVFADEVDGNRVIKRGYDIYVRGNDCLLVEDVINTGITVTKTKLAVEKAGGRVAAVAALCNRSGGKVTAETLGVQELVSLIDVDMQMFKEGECPICRVKGPQSVRTDLGKGKEFLARIGKV